MSCVLRKLDQTLQRKDAKDAKEARERKAGAEEEQGKGAQEAKGD
jgi:hypothetical protein